MNEYFEGNKSTTFFLHWKSQLGTEKKNRLTTDRKYQIRSGTKQFFFCHVHRIYNTIFTISKNRYLSIIRRVTTQSEDILYNNFRKKNVRIRAFGYGNQTQVLNIISCLNGYEKMCTVHAHHAAYIYIYIHISNIHSD